MIALPACASLCGTLAAAAIDVRTGRIPNVVTLPTALAALAAAATLGQGMLAFGGAVAVGGALLVPYALTKARGLGYGDVKLGLAIGIGFGPTRGIAAVGIAFVLGGCYAAVLLATGRGRRGDAVPFAPFLAGGALSVATAMSAGYP